MRTQYKDINFLPERILRVRHRRRNNLVYTLVGVLLFAFISAMIYAPYHTAQLYREELNDINAEITKLDPAQRYVVEKLSLKSELLKKEAALADVLAKQFEITGLLQKINYILPANCFVSSLTIDQEGKFTIEVVTPGPVETAKVLVGLRGLGIFEQVTLADVQHDGRTGEVPLTPANNEPLPVTFNAVFNWAKKESGNGATEQADDLQAQMEELQGLIEITKPKGEAR